MSTPGDPNDIPPISNVNPKPSRKITAGKYAGIIAGAVIICELVNFFSTMVIP